MQQKLVIYLHNHDSTRPSWVDFDAEAGIKQYVQHGNAEDLAKIAADKKVIVIVPAQEVVLISAKLPKMNRSRLAQALPYALEEQLVGDVETLHFASNDMQADGSLAIAIVFKEKMQEWQALLHAWKVQADVLIPSSMALPVEENTWMVILKDMAIIRMSDYQCFACDINNLNEFMHIALQSSEQKPQSIHIHNYTQNEITAMLTATIDIKEDFHEAERLEMDMADNAIQFTFINLLQGQFKTRKSRFPEMRKMWRTSIYLAIAWVVLLFLYPTISYFILEKRVSSIDAQITAIYKRHFPQAASIVAPKLRMEEKLQKLTAQAGESKLMLLINYLGKGMMDTPSINLKRLDFQNNQLTLDLTAASSEDFSKFTEFLTRQGLNVKQQSANLVGVRVNAIITVE